MRWLNSKCGRLGLGLAELLVVRDDDLLPFITGWQYQYDSNTFGPDYLKFSRLVTPFCGVDSWSSKSVNHHFCGPVPVDCMTHSSRPVAVMACFVRLSIFLNWGRPLPIQVRSSGSERCVGVRDLVTNGEHMLITWSSIFVFIQSQGWYQTSLETVLLLKCKSLNLTSMLYITIIAWKLCEDSKQNTLVATSPALTISSAISDSTTPRKIESRSPPHLERDVY